ncbi:DLA class II histocompatibility antigen, DR-1 beta chain [Liparis tanakae]|uniref:DLA class II histocompatibility antigen, DR-1 beta chain n=1 Tax=Liparis tanakae TaxID=230148 RepID=A0A4Z2IF29_9TELE|nr:DLA class II histocompatibility antigen, DR-1 beta chain [Liparis tanakae]
MKRSALIILMINSLCAFSQIPNEFDYVVGCSENETTEAQYEFNGDELLYVDFDRKEIVYTVPRFVIDDPSKLFDHMKVFQNAKKNKVACSVILTLFKAEEKSPPEEKDATMPVHSFFSLLFLLLLCSRAVEPSVRLKSANAAGSTHQSMLICSVYGFYPKDIRVTWQKNGNNVTSDVTSTEELSNGNWLYQIHSYLEFTPKTGEKITCMVEHASLTEPKLYEWDPIGQSQRNKIAVGTAGLVLGLVFSVTGLIYYKKKHVGRILVPTS